MDEQQDVRDADTIREAALTLHNLDIDVAWLVGRINLTVDIWEAVKKASREGPKKLEKDAADLENVLSIAKGHHMGNSVTEIEAKLNETWTKLRHLEKFRKGRFRGADKKEAHEAAVLVHDLLYARLPGPRTKRKVGYLGAQILYALRCLDHVPQGTRNTDSAVNQFNHYVHEGKSPTNAEEQEDPPRERTTAFIVAANLKGCSLAGVERAAVKGDLDIEVPEGVDRQAIIEKARRTIERNDNFEAEVFDPCAEVVLNDTFWDWRRSLN